VVLAEGVGPGDPAAARPQAVVAAGTRARHRDARNVARWPSSVSAARLKRSTTEPKPRSRPHRERLRDDGIRRQEGSVWWGQNSGARHILRAAARPRGHSSARD